MNEKAAEQLERARKKVGQARPRHRGGTNAADTLGQLEIALAISAVAEAVLALAEIAAQEEDDIPKR